MKNFFFPWVIQNIYKQFFFFQKFFKLFVICEKLKLSINSQFISPTNKCVVLLCAFIAICVVSFKTLCIRNWNKKNSRSHLFIHLLCGERWYCNTIVILMISCRQSLSHYLTSYVYTQHFLNSLSNK